MVDNDHLLDILLNKMENVDRLSIKELTKLENLPSDCALYKRGAASRWQNIS
jgi:hypothetical protein